MKNIKKFQNADPPNEKQIKLLMNSKKQGLHYLKKNKHSSINLLKCVKCNKTSIKLPFISEDKIPKS